MGKGARSLILFHLCFKLTEETARQVHPDLATLLDGTINLPRIKW